MEPNPRGNRWRSCRPRLRSRDGDLSSVRSLIVRLALVFLTGISAGGVTTFAQAQDDLTLVRVDRVRLEPLAQTVPVLGRLVARQAGEVAARINGPVESFQVEVGDRVEAGQVIAQLNQRYLKAERDLAAAELAKTNAQITTAQAELSLAQQDLNRLSGLKKSAAFNQARFDDARQNVVIAEGKVKEAEAVALSAQADLELNEINLSYAEIRAPYGGVISQRLTEAGAYVQIGAAVVRMVADQSLEIEADVPFQRLSGVKPGTRVGVKLDDGTNHNATARAIVPEENPLTRTRAVRFVPEFGEFDRPLAVDQSVTVHVPVGTRRDVLTVHKDAVIRRGSNSFVYVAIDGIAERRQISLGESTGGRFEVLDGLQENEQVVVRGNERLRPGDKLRINGAS